MAQQPRLRMLHFELFPQQRIVLEIQHPQAQVQAGPPIGVNLAQLVQAERSPLDCRTSRSVGGNRSVGAKCVGDCGGRGHDSDAPFGSMGLVTPRFGGKLFDSKPLSKLLLFWYDIARVIFAWSRSWRHLHSEVSFEQSKPHSTAQVAQSIYKSLSAKLRAGSGGLSSICPTNVR